MKLLKKLKSLIFGQDDYPEIKAAIDIYENMSKEERKEFLRHNPFEVEEHIWIPIRREKEEEKKRNIK